MTGFILAATASFALLGAPAKAVEREPVPVVAVASHAQEFADRLILRGRTEANRKVEVKSEIAGLVASPPLRKGAQVRAGEILCNIEDGGRTAELAEAKARLSEAQQNFEASEQLSKKGFTTETRANAMIAELAQAHARVLRAELNIERLAIAAPFDGILESDTAELGSLLQSGSTCATLIALDPIKLIAYVPERSVDAIEVGARIQARLITGREIEGRISFVSRAADRETRTYLVEAEAPNPDLAIRDGMTAEIGVALKSRMAHLAPQNALTLNDDGALGVRLAVDGVARFAPVTILKDEPRGVWLDGLPETADILVAGQEFVIDGAPLDVEYAEPDRIQ
ncbi:efflux RND transporter periplasmic adaptor subunit [Pikeienuella piscinae]|uniref:Efflux RND transporter periplasmic adaptor subunit n=1 Tax=Pikeienuella piscinae TaxID=2748098 RepID=A0A7L5BVL1_9RHOB|nr:efflux RND transporter periplasmic adaptor subunit [Pikeienuella piscinae]QIE54537.1 efflux RND transporter periplasmic adaptor subunit [Pikeienuella piscinae]